MDVPFPPFMQWDQPSGGIKISGSGFTVKNNIVASCWHSGYSLPAYKCDSDPVHTGNIAHSVSGYGLIVAGGAGGCSEFSDFKGYKMRIATIHMGGGTGSSKNVLHSIVSIDSAQGIMAFGASGGHVEVRDSTIYGG